MKLELVALCTVAVTALACTPAASSPADGGGSDAEQAHDTGEVSDGAVGSGCAIDDDCRVGLTCFHGPDGARPWPGGYCTRDCDSDTCPGDAVCGEAYVAADATQVLQCLASCTREAGSSGGCRAGYQCMNDGACHVGCASDAECETIDFDLTASISAPGSTCEIASGRCLRGSETGGEVGAACTTDAECRGPIGWCRDGSCYRPECDLGGAYACGDQAYCIGFRASNFQRRYACARACTIGEDALVGAPGRCFAGEACAPPESDYADHALGPYCRRRAGGGLAGDDTARVGDACTTVDDCPNPNGYGACTQGFCHVSYCGAASLGGTDLCGDGARCFTLEGDPETDTEFQLRDFMLGVCARDCSEDASVCAAGSSCGGEFCFP